MKAYAISLDDDNGRKRLGRLQGIMRSFPSIEFVSVPAIRGSAIRASDVSKVTSLTCGMLCTPAIVGISLSHMSIWEKIRDGPDSMGLVFEDDAIPLGDFDRDLRQAIEEAGTFDVLNLGCFMCDFRLHKVPTGVRDVNVFAGAHAYVLTKEGARKLLNIYSSVVFHIDMMMSAASMRGVILKATNKTLATQEGHETSSNATLTAFPGVVDSAMKSIHFDTGTDLSIYANTSHFRIGTWDHHVNVDATMIVMCLVGIAIGRYNISPWVAMVAVMATDIIWMGNPQDEEYSLSMIKTITAFVLGYGLGRLSFA
jgi:GR25 family glycosyltransferase involved in LPS biosynthesis